MEKDQNQLPTDAEAREARREFLKKAGRFAIYTPPAMMVLMRPSSAGIARSGASCRTGSHERGSWEPRSHPFQSSSSHQGGFQGSSNRRPSVQGFVSRLRSALQRFFS